MPNSYYSPNNKITGGCLFATFNSKDGCVFFKLLRQIANNVNKIGNFDGENPINVKLGQDEIADIIRAIRTQGESKFFHSFGEHKLTGTFKFYTVAAKDNFPARSGFGLSIKKTLDNVVSEVKISFSLGSSERLSLFLINSLNHIFDAEYSADIQQAREYKKKNSKPIESQESDDRDPPTTENGDF